MKHISNGITLHYEIYGTSSDERRPWIVFSHSLACNSSMWEPQLSAFAAKYRLLAFDTRGHGQSDAPSGPYKFDQMADDVEGLLRALQIKRAHFVGLSMGGMIGQVFALKYPTVLSSLTIADSTSKWPDAAIAMFDDRVKIAREKGMDALVKSTLDRWFTPPFHKSNPAEVAKIGDAIRTTPIAGYAGCSYAIPRVNTTQELKHIACPILVLVGRDDLGTPLAMSQTIHGHAPRSQLVILDRAAHISNIEQPHAFNQALEQFLASSC